MLRNSSKQHITAMDTLMMISWDVSLEVATKLVLLRDRLWPGLLMTILVDKLSYIYNVVSVSFSLFFLNRPFMEGKT